jgi:hypothetical protein
MRGVNVPDGAAELGSRGPRVRINRTTHMRALRIIADGKSQMAKQTEKRNGNCLREAAPRGENKPALFT